MDIGRVINRCIKFRDPNYDKLGNSLNYFVRSSNDKPNQGYENKLLAV